MYWHIKLDPYIRIHHFVTENPPKLRIGLSTLMSLLTIFQGIGLPSQFLRFYQNKSTNWIQISAYYLSCSSPMTDWKLMPHLFVFTANWELGHPRGKCRCGCAYFVMVYSEEETEFSTKAVFIRNRWVLVSGA